MLRKYARLLAPDAVEGASSDAQASAPGESQPPQSAPLGDKTLADVVTATADASLASGQEADKGLGTDVVPNGTAADQAATAQDESGKAADDAASDKQHDDSKLPFNEHPRWKQVYSERNEFEQKLRDAEGREAAIRPLLQAQMDTQEFCTKNGITVDQYRTFLNMAAAVNRDPEQFLQLVTPVVENARTLTGKTDRLDPDLQSAISEGKLDQEWARKIMQERGKARVEALKVNRVQGDVQEQNRRLIRTTIGTWDQQKRSSDPSFKPSANGTKGKWELVDAFFSAALAQAQNPDPVSVVALLESAYKDANHVFASTQPPRPGGPTGRTLPANGSSRQTNAEPKTLKELVFAVADGSYKPPL